MGGFNFQDEELTPFVPAVEAVTEELPVTTTEELVDVIVEETSNA